ncbi:thioredoxin family protein [Streptosporangiaceae bacterium NEAU-GS5]|nr:thioredoxin family protein [Streptosporangiaceae bacterium NEAU-GS5]
MAVNSFMVPLGTQAPDFDLPAIGGGQVALADFKGSPVVVVFLSNHCPYVRRIEAGLGQFAADYAGRVATVGICSNDTSSYPDDDQAHLAEQSNRAGFGFPYLVDESQEVARAYRAACTPDFFLFDADHKLAYRGEFDDARPGNDVAVSGVSLRAAADAALDGKTIATQHPSLGCSIKWRS